jgi:hypothetical protein
MHQSSASPVRPTLRGAAALCLFITLALGGCQPPSDQAYYNRGGPEALVDVSSEVVNLPVVTGNDLNELSSWIEKDHPTRAELYCTADDPRCIEALKVLDLEAVPTRLVPSDDYSVALVYERILAHDCNPRFVNNTPNVFNGYHPAFGCAISANMVQHVSDKQQFVSPNLSDSPSAKTGINATQRAYAPKMQEPQAYGVDQSVVSSASASAQ